MIFRIIKFFCILFFLFSCSQIDFVYNDESGTKNILYDETIVKISGVDLPVLNSYVSSYFGATKSPKFELNINVVQKKTKRSVETNQTVSKLRYDLYFTYYLSWLEKKCLVLEKNIRSTFSITPKSDGFNFGSDKSLDNKYELVVKQNLDEFVSFLLDREIYKCNK